MSKQHFESRIVFQIRLVLVSSSSCPCIVFVSSSSCLCLCLCLVFVSPSSYLCLRSCLRSVFVSLLSCLRLVLSSSLSCLRLVFVFPLSCRCRCLVIVASAGLAKRIQSARPLGQGVWDPQRHATACHSRRLRLASRCPPRMPGVLLHPLLNAITGWEFKKNSQPIFHRFFFFFRSFPRARCFFSRANCKAI